MNRPSRSLSQMLAAGLLACVLLFMAAPIVIVVINSFNTSTFNQWPPPGFTLDWYVKAFTTPQFQRGLANSVIVAGSATVLALLVGTPLAYGLTRFRIRGRDAIRAAIFGPMIVPRVALGLALFVLYLMTRSGLYGTLAGIVLAHIILVLPFVVAILSASIGEIDPIVEEAARDLGARPATAFLKAVLPQMRSGLIVAGLFAFVNSFDEVETTLFLAKPATNTLPLEMFHYLEHYQDPTVAAVSSLLIAISFFAVFLALGLVRGRVLLRMLTTESAR